MPGLNKEELEQAVERGVELWLDKQFSKFGKWSLAAIGATALAILLRIAVQTNFWRN